MQPHVHQDDDAPHAHPEARPRPLNIDQVIPGGSAPTPLGEVPQALQASPPLNEAIHQGAEFWFAREFVGGLVSVAEALKIPVQDFLADKVFVLSQRLALAESEVQILRHRVTEVGQENIELHRKLDDCNCHDEATIQSLSDSDVSLSRDPSTDITNNGDSSP